MVLYYTSLTQQTAVGVLNVVDSGPADEAGLQAGDAMVGLNGSPTNTMDDMLRQVSQHKSGARILLDVLRSGMRSEIPLSLGETK